MSDRLQRIKDWLNQFQYPGEFRGFQIKKVDGKGSQTFYDFESVKKWFLEKDYNCWYSVANTIAERRRKQDMGHCRFLWADMDHMTIEEARKRIERAGLPTPTIMVGSGHGAQPLWKLDEWLNLQDKEDAARLERMLRTIASLVGGDTNAIKLTQVLRIPWTHNPKDPPADATLEEQNENAYPIETFDVGEGIEALKWVWKTKPEIDEDLGIPGLYELTFTTFAGYAFHHEVPLEDARAVLEELISAREKGDQGVEGPTLLEALENTYKAGDGGEKVNYKGLQGKRYEAIVIAALKTLWGDKAKLQQDAIQLGSNRWITNNEDGIRNWFYRGSKKARKLSWDFVTTAGITLTDHYSIDGDGYWSVKGLSSGVFDRKGILAEYEKLGYIVGHKYFNDSLSAIISNGPAAVPGHATIGVYVEEGGLLKFCSVPMPVKPLQKTTNMTIKSAVDRIPTKEEIQAYVSVLRHWKDFEILPSLGLGFVSPFSLLLRSKGKLVPHILSQSAVSDLGKSLIAYLFSSGLYLIDGVSGDAINSVFRLMAFFDSVCGTRAIDEATLKAMLWDLLKDGAESDLITGRGQMNQDLPMAHARQCFLITSNEELLSDKLPVAKRFVIIRFDPTDKVLKSTAERREISREVRRLRPIGWGCAKIAAEKIATEKRLMEQIEDWEEKISALYDSWKSPKRAEIWAVLYQGLQNFIMVCKGLGIDFDYPIEDWVKNVVIPVEEEMQEGSREPFEYYLDGRLGWRLQHTVRGGIVDSEDGGFNLPPTIKGEGEYWRSKPLNIDGRSIEGEWHVHQLVTEINDLIPQGHKTYKMIDVGRLVVNYLGLPQSALNKVVRTVAMGIKFPKAVFIPIE